MTGGGFGSGAGPDTDRGREGAGLPELLVLGDSSTAGWLADPAFERVGRSLGDGDVYRHATVRVDERAPTAGEWARADCCVFAGFPDPDVCERLDRADRPPVVALVRDRTYGPPVDPLLGAADLVVQLDADRVAALPRNGYESDADVYERVLREVTAALYEAASPFTDLPSPARFERLLARGGRCALFLGSVTPAEPWSLELDRVTTAGVRSPELFLSVVLGGVGCAPAALRDVAERLPDALGASDPVANLHAVRSSAALDSDEKARVLVLATRDRGEGEFDAGVCGGCLPHFG